MFKDSGEERIEMKKICLAIGVLIALEGCSYVSKISDGLAIQFRKMEEPADGDRARIRAVRDGWVRASPGVCMDWKQTGTVLGGVVGSNGYRGRIIGGMPDPNLHRHKTFAEFYVRADEPIAIAIVDGPEVKGPCDLAVTFVPKKDHDYDFYATSRLTGIKRECSILVSDITNGDSTPIEIKEAQACP